MDAMHPFPVDVQQRIVSASLNSQILQNFITGIYTVVFTWTMYLYMSRKGQNKWVVVSAISTLYLLYILNWVIPLYWMNQVVVVNGGTRESIAIFTVMSPSPALAAFSSFICCFGFVVADALLIWRCYHVWGKSLRVIVVPLALLLAQIGLVVCRIALSVLLGVLFASPHLALLQNSIVSATVLASLATTVITTCLIGYRIHTVTRQNSTISRNRFKYIVVMIVESAVVASINLLVYAIFWVILVFSHVGTPESCALLYDLALVYPISGMIPTILMARLAVKSPDGDTISAPTFVLPPDDVPDVNSGSDSGPVTGGNSNHEEGAEGERHSATEIEEIARESIHGANMEGNSGGSIEWTS